jgi:hypothetical protein
MQTETPAAEREDLSFYNVTRKADAVFRLQLSLMSDPVKLDGFLSDGEVAELLREEARKPASSRRLRPPEDPLTYITCDCWEKPERKLLLPRLEEILGSFWVWGANYFKTLVPYWPHVDTGVGLRAANYKNVLLPLDIEGEGETHIVFFKQRYFGDNTQFFRSGQALDPEATCSGELFDYSQVLYLNGDEPFDRAIFDEYLSNCNYENLRGLTVDRILPWTVGSCYLFDSAQIHCASNFFKQGIRSKTGLSLFTCKSE